jgi:hypothetical protein
MFSACRSTRQVVQQTKSDSTTVSYREVEKTIHIEGDTLKTNMQAQLNKPTENVGSEEKPEFTPQTQTLETKRTKVTIELTKTGEIKATAVSKDIEEKVTVQEKTISNYKSETTEYQQKESWLAKAWHTTRGWMIGILFSLVFMAVIVTAIKLGFNPFSWIIKLFSKS